MRHPVAVKVTSHDPPPVEAHGRRNALAPIIVLAFGIGDTSKVVTSWIVVVFLVFFNTFEGARSIDEGFVNVARLLGASEWQITRTVVVPSTRLRGGTSRKA